MTVSGADLITRVCGETGHDVTAASADRALILSYINQALSNAALEAEIYTPPTPATVTLAQGTASYDLTSSPFAITGLIAIDEILLTDGSVTSIPLEQVTASELLSRQQGAGQAQGTPYCYSVEYPGIDFYPTPAASTTLSVFYTAEPTVIADSAVAVTVIPAAFLWGVLCEFAIAMGLRNKKQPEWTIHMQAYMSDKVAGLPALRRWKRRVAGKQRPSSGPTRARVTSPSQDTGY